MLLGLNLDYLFLEPGKTEILAKHDDLSLALKIGRNEKSKFVLRVN